MRTHILFFIIACLLSTVPAQAGGWPQPQGGIFLKLFEWWVVSDQHYTDAGLVDPNTTTGVFNTALYAEYGFTDRLTGLLYFPFFSRTYFNNTRSGTTGELLIPGEALQSIGDTDVGLKYGFTPGKRWALSATLLLGLPLGRDNGGTAGQLQTGDGEFNQLLQMDLGTSFQLGKFNGYANVLAGFNNRTQRYSDEIRYGAEAGLNWWQDRLTTILRLYGVKSLLNGDLPAERSNSTSIFANNSEYLSLSPEVAMRLGKHWGVSAGTGIALSGTLIFAAPSYSVGVFARW